MSLCTLPLSYCTNVHPGMTVAEVLRGLRDYTLPARQRFGERLAAGLWLADPVTDELHARTELIVQLRELLREGDLICYTLNTFPYGNFHSARVKENVYLPDWTSPERLSYTLRCAYLLAALKPPGVEGSLSTVPLGFKGFPHGEEFLELCIKNLLMLARSLDHLHDETGQVIRLAIEPEPCCVLETTAEALAFFDRLFAAAKSSGELDIARRHLGVCYDVCHQAVEFESVSESIQKFQQADVRLNKIHITCAIHVDRPGENPQARAELEQFVEQRYLHQTFAKGADGQVRHIVDLNSQLCREPDPFFQQAQAWRVHFHAPVHRESLGNLGTTRAELREALRTVAQLEYAPHLEVETYTWGVLPGEQPKSLTDGLVAELEATRELLQEIGAGEK